MTWIVQLNEKGFAHQIQLVDAVNFAKNEYEHALAIEKLAGFRIGCDACGVSWMPCEVDLEIMAREKDGEERPLCCGVYLDWKPQNQEK